MEKYLTHWAFPRVTWVIPLYILRTETLGLSNFKLDIPSFALTKMWNAWGWNRLFTLFWIMDLTTSIINHYCLLYQSCLTIINRYWPKYFPFDEVSHWDAQLNFKCHSCYGIVEGKLAMLGLSNVLSAPSWLLITSQAFSMCHRSLNLACQSNLSFLSLGQCVEIRQIQYTCKRKTTKRIQ